MTRLVSEIRPELRLRERRVQRRPDRLRLVALRAVPEAEGQIGIPVHDGDGVRVRGRGPDGLGEGEELADREGLFGVFGALEDAGVETGGAEEAGLLAYDVGGD